MRRTLLLCLLSLVVVPSAEAEVRLVDTATGSSRTILRDDPGEPYTEAPHLVRFADDAAVLVRRRGRVERIGLADGSVQRMPWLDKAEAVGPGGRSIHLRYHDEPRVTLRAPDGRRIASYDYAGSDWEPSVAWTSDGALVAFARPPVMKVMDTATGAVVMDRRVSEELEFTTQAWSPDATALLVTDGPRLLRLDVPSGATTELYRGRADPTPSGSWGETGRIVVNDGWRVRVLDDPPLAVRISDDRLSAAEWSLTGTALTFSYSGPLDDCDYPNEGVAALVPGGLRRVLVPPGHRKLVRNAETPDGRHLAFDLEPGEDREPEHRGKRKPWPKRIPRDYGMGSRRGNAAMRRVVVRAARRLRHGAGRHRVLIGVRTDQAEVSLHFPVADDSDVEEGLADEIDGWLVAAGFHGVDALDEVSC